MRKIMYCSECRNYTLKDKCIKCFSKTVRNAPVKYSLSDKYAGLRRKELKDELISKGLL